MADIDDFISSRVQGNRRQADPAPSDGTSDIDEFIKSRVHEPASPIPSDDPGTFLGRSLDVAKGAGKALVGMGASIGDISGPPEAHIIPTPFSIAQRYRDWANEPSGSTAESVGYDIGSVIPGTVLGPLGIGGRVAKTLAGGVTGAIEAGLQPTTEGTLGSHLSAMPVGFVAGAFPGMGGTTLHGLAMAARAMHIPIPHIPRVASMAFHKLMQAINDRTPGASAAVRRAQALYSAHYFSNLARQAQRATSATAGAVTGQALGTRYDPQEHSDASR